MTYFKSISKIDRVESSYTIVVSDSDLLARVCGTNDSNLRLIEEHLGVPVFTRGNELSLSDADSAVCNKFKEIINRITNEAECGVDVCADMVHSILKNTVSDDFDDSYISIPGGLKRVYPKTKNQAKLIRILNSSDMVFCVGPAGSGKTFLAMAKALSLLLSHKVRKLILTRPVVEAGESLGFLPGDLEQKINPYLRPLFDSMEALLPHDILRRLDEAGMIEIAPLAYMRGRTLENCAILLDEAQNTTSEQMKMFLTRMGENSRMFITGDISQIDLPKKIQSGLVHALSILKNIPEIKIVEFQEDDVVRNPLVRKIIRAYNYAEQAN